MVLGMRVSAGVEGMGGPTLPDFDRPSSTEVLTISKCYPTRPAALVGRLRWGVSSWQRRSDAKLLKKTLLSSYAST